MESAAGEQALQVQHVRVTRASLLGSDVRGERAGGRVDRASAHKGHATRTVLYLCKAVREL